MGLPLQTLSFDKLRGIQTKKSLTNKSNVDAQSCANGFFDVSGAFVKRKGGQKKQQTALAGSVSGGYDFRYSNNTSQQMITCADQYIYSDSSGSFASIKSGMTTGNLYDFAQYNPVVNDYLFITNGVDTMLKYDGTTVTNASIVRPSTAPTATAAAGGSITTGTYLIRVTFGRDNGSGEIQESNPSDQVSITLAGANHTINLSAIPTSTDTQVNRRYIYITSVGGADLFNVATISDNTTTSYSFTTDPALGYALEYDHDPAPLIKFIDFYKDCFVGAGNSTYPNRIYVTKQYDTWYWPQGDLDEQNARTFDVGNKPITAVVAFYDLVLIFNDSEIYAFQAASAGDVNTFSIDRIRSDDFVGCCANQSIVVYENWCYFLSRNGYYRTNGITIQKVSFPIDGFFSNLETDDNFKINKLALQNACATTHKEEELILLFMPTGSSSVNNVCFSMGLRDIVADQDTGQASPNWAPWTGFNTTYAWNVYDSGRIKWYRGDDFGFVYKQDTLDGDGTEVTSDVTSSTNSTLTDSVQSWTINAYVGLVVYIISGTGIDQFRTITANTADTLTVDTAWDSNPDTTSIYTIGGIDFYYEHSWDDYGNPSVSKRWNYSRPRFNTTGNFDIGFTYGYDFDLSDNDQETINLFGSSEWDQDFWDQAIWDGIYVTQRRYRIPANRIHRWSNFKVRNRAAGQPITYNGFDKIFQMKGIR